MLISCEYMGVILKPREKGLELTPTAMVALLAAN